MAIQELIASNLIFHLHSKIKTITGYSLIGGLYGFSLYLFLETEYVFAYFDNMTIHVFNYFSNVIYQVSANNDLTGILVALSIMFLLLMSGVTFSIAICHLCNIKKLIPGILYIIGIYGILLFLLFDLQYISLISIDLGFWQIVIALCMPLAIAAVCGVLISITHEIENEQVSYILLGSAALYAMICFFIGNILRDYIFYSSVMEIFNFIFLAVVAIILLACGIFVINSTKETGDGSCLVTLFALGIPCGLIALMYEYLNNLMWITVPLFYALAMVISILPSGIILYKAERWWWQRVSSY